MPRSEPVILLDPHLRPTNLIFNAGDKGRLERLGQVVSDVGSAAPEALIDQRLPDTIAPYRSDTRAARAAVETVTRFRSNPVS